MNKKIPSFLFPILIFFSFSLHAQDLIILLAGDTIQTTIVNASDSGILFKCIQIPGSTCFLSNTVIRKASYANGTELKIDHFNTYSNNQSNLPDSSLVFINGNSYFYNGIKVKHEELENIYHPLHDSLLNSIYYKAMNMKRGSITLTYLPIPIGGIGLGLFLDGIFPTNYIFSPEPEFGHDHLIIPGFLFIGGALISSMLGIVTHHVYKVILKKSALRYNSIISKNKFY